MPRFPFLRTAPWPLIVLVAAVALLQFNFWRHSEPIIFPDTPSYQDPVAGILKGEWSRFHFRTPGYPAFLALVQAVAGLENYRAVVAVQFVLAGLIPLLLFGIFRPLLKSGWLALLPAMAYYLDWISVGLPATILTEPTSQVLLVATVAICVVALRRMAWRLAPVLGLWLVVVLLVRPAFQLLPYALLGVTLISGVFMRQHRSWWKRTLAWWSVVLVIAQGFTWAWSYKVYRETDHFALSLLTGIALLNHMGPLVHEVPEEMFDPWRRVHLDVLAERNGNHINAGFRAIEILGREEGMAPWHVAEGYKEMSLWLMRHHPGYYMRTARSAFRQLLIEVPIYLIEPSTLSAYLRKQGPWSYLYPAIERHYWRHGSRLYATAALFVLGLATYVVVCRRNEKAVLTGLLLLAIVGYTAFIHAAVNNTELGRYRLAVQPLIFSTLGFLLVRSVQRFVVKNSQPSEDA